MIKVLKIKNLQQEIVTCTISTLKEENLNQVVNLQKEVVNRLENKEYFFKTDNSEFRGILTNEENICLGCFNESNELIAYGMFIKPTLVDNYGSDINLEKDLLPLVGHIESTIVHPNYRGNSLQKHLIATIEDLIDRNKFPILCATVHPDNKASLKTFLKLGYKVKIEKEKYGGLRRCVVMKSIADN
ncbi:MAG TPA: GNAT family N-acetyltransferase [Clostridium sp.]|nr:GNAT family N-acetyltransferase [Clostridium sp.]